MELLHYRGFIRRHAHILARWPRLFFGLAANSPEESPVAKEALGRWEGGLERRPWLRRLTGRGAGDPCLFTILPDLRVHTCVFSPDGRHLVAAAEGCGATDQATVLSWDSESGKEVSRLRVGGGGVTGLAFAGGGTRIVTYDLGSVLTVREWPTGSELTVLAGHELPVTTVAVSGDGANLLSTAWAGSDEPGEIILWSLPAGKQSEVRDKRNGGFMVAGGFSPDSSLFLVSDGRVVTLRRSSNGRTVGSLSGHTDDVETCAFSHDGSRVVSGGRDWTLIVWDPRKRKLLLRLQGHGGPIWSCAIAPDDRYVASASEDWTVKLWEMRSGKLVADLTGHEKAVRRCAFSPDGERLVSVDAGGVIRVWDVPRAALSTPLTPSGSAICEFSPDGEKMVLAKDANTLEVVDQRTGTGLAEIVGKPRKRDPRDSEPSEVVHQITACRYSPDGRFLAVAEKDDWYEGNGITILDGKDFREVCYLHEGGSHALGCLQFSEDGSRLLGGMVEPPARLLSRGVLHSSWAGYLVKAGDVRVWNPEAGLEMAQLAGHEHYVSSLSASPDGRWCVSASLTTVRAWDMELGVEVWSHDHPSDRLVYAAFTPDGNHVVLWTMGSMRMVEYRGDSAAVKVVAMEDGKVSISLAWESLSIDACCIAPDGRHVYVATSDGSVRTLDFARRCEVLAWRGTGRVRRLSCTPDGRSLAIASRDGLLTLMDAADHTQLASTHVPEDIRWMFVPGDGRDGDSGTEFILSGVRYRPAGFSLGTPLLTPVYLYSYAQEDWEDSPSVRCPRCLLRLVPPAESLEAIADLHRGLTVTAGSSICLESAAEAWGDPRLAIRCPNCGTPLTLNPYCCDHRGLAPVGPFPGREKRSVVSPGNPPETGRVPWWRIWQRR